MKLLCSPCMVYSSWRLLEFLEECLARGGKRGEGGEIKKNGQQRYETKGKQTCTSSPAHRGLKGQRHKVFGSFFCFMVFFVVVNILQS